MFGQITKFVNKEITGAFSSIRDQLGSTTGIAQYESGAVGLMYPLELRGQKNRPCIEFTAYDTSSGSVDLKTLWFPCPSNVSISDSASYSTIDLGALGGAAASAISAGAGAGGGVGTKISAGVGNIANQAKSLKGGEIAALASAAIPDAIGEKMRFAAKTLINPNSNTTFTGNPIRTFSFQFKMIARSQQEAQEIQKIHSTFRKYSYADSNGNQQNLTLRYPPVWRIRFLDGQQNENKYIPKIYSCYLTTVSSNFNATSATFHTDGSPLEVDITIGYQETRALTRFDIENLATDENRGINIDTGLATTQQSAEIDGGGAGGKGVIDKQLASWESTNNESK
jgi:hypothetical protein